MLKLIASDLDGTLLNQQQKISPLNRYAIAKAQEKGVRFVIATGRNYARVQDLLTENDLHCDLLLMNGSEVRDARGNIISSINLPLEPLKQVVELLHAHGMEPEFMTNRETCSIDPPEQALRSCALRMQCFHPGISYEEGLELAHTDPFYTALRFVDGLEGLYQTGLELRKIVSYHPDTKVIDRLTEQFNAMEGLVCMSSFPVNLEITNARAQKGWGLEKAIEVMGIQRDEVAVFGDGMNDYNMFTCFPRCYAPQNAVGPIQALAKEVIPRHDEDGVGKTILRLLEEDETPLQ